MARLAFYFFCLWQATALMLHAQVQVDATLSSTQVAVGDTVALSISIRGRQAADARPEFQVDGLDIEYSGSQVQTIINNGVVSGFYLYRYTVTPERNGEFVIPSVDVTVAGQIYKTAELKLVATDAPEAPKELEPILQLSVGKTELWEGEVIPLSLTLLVNTESDVANLELPSIKRDDFVVKRWPNGPDQDLERIGSATYRKITYRTSVTPLKAGELILGPAEVKADIYLPQGGRRDPFGGGGRVRKFTLKSNEVKINCKALPEDGKPENFTGAVGNFSLRMEADPLEAEVDFPIMTKIQVDGVGNFDSLTPPLLESEEGWRVMPSKRVVDYRGTGLEQGSALYFQQIRPQDERKEIPSYVLPYFNPQTAKYEIARTEPVKIRVRPNQQSRTNPAGPNSGTAAVDFGVTPLSVPEEQMKSVLTIRPSSPSWQAIAAPSSSGLPWWTWHAVGGSALACIFGAGMWQRMAAAAAVRKSRLSEPPTCEELLRQMRAEHSSSSRFYKLACDYLQSWQYYTGAPLPSDSDKGETVRRIFHADGVANYSGKNPPALTAQERQEIISALGNF